MNEPIEEAPAPRGWRDRYALYAALVVAWVAMLGSLYFSDVKGYLPCLLCWYQRILMYPLALGILPIGLLRRDEHLPYMSLFFSGVGMVLSAYHYLLQKGIIFASSGACGVGVPCTTQYINWLDFITIPFLALIAFILIFLASVIALTTRRPLWERGEGHPWLPVVGLVVLVAALFAPLFLGLIG
ncbi:MAG: disulfide bond formation protein B [Anaerolineales bacterium]|nr:disulfide bond formation protein B [Anaerolineales bacterium]MCB9127079.1 disulfide bond formation protein B [Ardenticatenales bacterium]MCB9172396.1 disulfide bond formation protein B [Ardenticatenales bacterium]